MQLLRRLVNNLKRSKACKNQERKPTWFVNFSPIKPTFGIENVPECALPKLQEKLQDYMDRPIQKKKHMHEWILKLEEHGILWLACKDEQCDAEHQLLVIDYLGITQKIILPHYRSLQNGTPIYQTRKEKRRIKDFLRDYKDEAIREAFREIAKELAIYQKILRGVVAAADELKLQRQIRKLERDKSDIETAMLVL